MTRAIVLTSSALRHSYFVKIAASRFDVRGTLLEEKRNYYVAQRATSPLIVAHFSDLRDSEQRLFGDAGGVIQTANTLCVADINEPAALDWAMEQSPDIILLFGTSILRDGWLNRFPDRIINLHLGLSPYYRGSATLFWPFVHRELECLGTTIHLAEAKVDAGRILSRIKPDWIEGDNYYSTTHKLIRKSIDAMPQIVDDYINGRCAAIEQERVNGRLCRKADFSEDALRNVLAYTETGIPSAEIARAKRSQLCRCLL